MVIINVSQLGKEHLLYYESSWTDSAVRRVIIRGGAENLDDIFLLRLADIYGMHRVPLQQNSPSWNLLVELKKRIEKLLNENSALSLKDLKVNGKDLMAEGIPSGKIMGKILNELFETVTDSPEMNDKEKLISLAKKLFSEKYSA